MTRKNRVLIFHNILDKRRAEKERRKKTNKCIIPAT